ncbi:MAG: hypothetical protein J6331_04620, partial [Lentisphaeria bacterium]|nr:hypothetical protein [Lentisphaeria bacterium]
MLGGVFGAGNVHIEGGRLIEHGFPQKRAHVGSAFAEECGILLLSQHVGDPGKSVQRPRLIGVAHEMGFPDLSSRRRRGGLGDSFILPAEKFSEIVSVRLVAGPVHDIPHPVAEEEGKTRFFRDLLVRIRFVDLFRVRQKPAFEEDPAPFHGFGIPLLQGGNVSAVDIV